MNNPVGTEQQIKNEQVASEISSKIAMLTNFDGDSLKSEMQALKEALQKNPAACALLHDEDLGLAVTALRRMLGVAIASANAPKVKGEKTVKVGSKKLTPAELAAELAKISDDDL